MKLEHQVFNTPHSHFPLNLSTTGYLKGESSKALLEPSFCHCLIIFMFHFYVICNIFPHLVLTVDLLLHILHSNVSFTYSTQQCSFLSVKSILAFSSKCFTMCSSYSWLLLKWLSQSEQTETVLFFVAGLLCSMVMWLFKSFFSFGWKSDMSLWEFLP